MHPLLAVALMHTIHYGSVALTYAEKARALVWKLWIAYWYPIPVELAPTTRYFIGYPSIDLESHLTVPQGAVYIEEWVRESTKKCVVRYAGDPIPRQWTESPFAKHARTPWVWVGDRETEIDLTRTFNKFLVVGNRITVELVESLIRVTPKTRLIYIQSGTFKELDFPGDGLTIEDYDDRPVQSCGSVHRTEETVPPAVVGGRNDSVE